MIYKYYADVLVSKFHYLVVVSLVSLVVHIYYFPSFISV